MTAEQIDIEVTVKALTSNYKRDPLEAAFTYPMPTPAYENTGSRKLDPDYVGVQLLFHGKDQRDFVLNMLMSTEHAKQLSLMIGDKLTLKITKNIQ